MERRAIRNIVFDLGGVLIDLDRQRCIDAFTALGFPQIERMLDYYRPVGIFNRLERGDATVAETCEAIRREAGNPTLTDRQLCDAYCAFLTGIPVAKLRFVRRLREAGYRTYALSNINEMVWPTVADIFFRADGHDVDHYFERLYLSFRMGALKPDAEIFESMIADSGMCPEETLFVDDSPHNVEAALKLGFEVYRPALHEALDTTLGSLLQEER